MHCATKFRASYSSKILDLFRPLHQQLEENRVAEQEALNDSLALSEFLK